jgi:hypothetical protein
MEPSPNNPRHDASQAQAPPVDAPAMEASRTPTQPTQAYARSRSAGRNESDGDKAGDERRPQRMRQPAIGGVDASPTNFSGVEASGTQLRGDVQSFAPRASSVASSDTQVQSNPVDEWNARLNSYGGYGYAGAMDASRGFHCPGQQQWTQPYGYGGYGAQAAYPQTQHYGSGFPQQPPYGNKYTDTSGAHWVWNQYMGTYEPDLAEEAAGYSLPSDAGSVSQSAGSLNAAMLNMQTGPGWQVSAAQPAPLALGPKPAHVKLLTSVVRLCPSARLFVRPLPKPIQTKPLLELDVSSSIHFALPTSSMRGRICKSTRLERDG